MDSRFQFREEIFSSLQCNVCLMFQVYNKELQPQSSGKVLTCTGCKLIKYCGQEHQKLDWRFHRKFCQTVKKILKSCQVVHPLLLWGPITNNEELSLNIMRLRILIRSEIGRELQFREEEIVSFPEICNVCFDLKAPISCQNCKAVSYCSRDHADKDLEGHSKKCGFLAWYYCPFKTFPLELKDPPKIMKNESNLLEKDLISCFETVTDKKLPIDPLQSYEAFQKYGDASIFSWIFTICYAIEASLLNEKIAKKFKIFVLGATLDAFNFRERHFAIFFKQYPAVKDLELYFIGPEVNLDICKETCCRFKNKKATLKSYKMVFQDFCKNFDINPDIIVSFNCGFSEVPPLAQKANIKSVTAKVTNTWENGIKQMTLTKSVPIVFTSYSRMEAHWDYDCIVEVAKQENRIDSMKTVIAPQRNPYRDLRPLRQGVVGDEEDIYYRNGYIACVMFQENHDSSKIG